MKKINLDLKSKQAIYLKSLLFVFIWILSIVLNLTSEELSYKIVSIILVVWASARLYYFMFYVIEHFVDDEFKFSSVYDFVLYLFKKKGEK